MVEPKIVKGFRDFLPQQEELRQRLMRLLADVYRQRGYMPIDTPVLEYAETLLGKSGGETEKQIFRFADAGGRDVALRFDLTVPFARYLAMHKEAVGLPFKRFHIGKAWRGEKPQKGRYREFVQCDFDIAGADSAAADLEILLTAASAFAALGVQGYTIRLNHRGLLDSFLTRLGKADKKAEALRAIDRLAKVGPQAVEAELREHLGQDASRQTMQFVQVEESLASALEKMRCLAGDTPALARLQTVFEALQQLGLTDHFIFDPSIARGLDYYTGLVFETFLNDLPAIGSVCSGGRYDNLAGLYSQDSISGAGGSIGLDRLLAALEELGALPETAGNPQFLIFSTPHTAQAHKALQKLHQAGFCAELFPQDKKMEAQYKYAARKGIGYGIFVEEDGSFSIKNLANKETRRGIGLAQLAAAARETA